MPSVLKMAEKHNAKNKNPQREPTHLTSSKVKVSEWHVFFFKNHFLLLLQPNCGDSCRAWFWRKLSLLTNLIWNFPFIHELFNQPPATTCFVIRKAQHWPAALTGCNFLTFFHSQDLAPGSSASLFLAVFIQSYPCPVLFLSNPLAWAEHANLFVLLPR